MADIFGQVGSITTTILNSMIWLAIGIVIAIVIGVAIVLWLRNRHFVYNVLIVRDLGSGKPYITLTQGGYLPRNKVFFGLISKGGELQFETKNKFVVQNISDVDMCDINHKKGFICYQKPDDRKVLVPVKPLEFDELGKYSVAKIAPADLRDAAVRIKQANAAEMRADWEQYIPYIVLSLIAICFIIGLIFTIHFAQSSIQESWQHLTDARAVLDAARSTANAAPSSAP